MSATCVPCLACGVIIVPFGESDIGNLVLLHQRDVHGHDIAPELVDRRHPCYGLIPEPVA